MSTGEQPAAGTDDSDEATGLSPFIARILGQLSLSAWLPAGLLTLALTLLIQFRALGVIDLSKAVNALTKDKGTLLILTVPVLISVTLITQAFSFEAIRTLEGYWYRPVLGTLARSVLTRWHLRRKKRLHAKRLKASHKAFLEGYSRAPTRTCELFQWWIQVEPVEHRKTCLKRQVPARTIAKERGPRPHFERWTCRKFEALERMTIESGAEVGARLRREAMARMVMRTNSDSRPRPSPEPIVLGTMVRVR